MTRTMHAWRKANAYVRSGQHDRAIYWLSRTQVLLPRAGLSWEIAGTVSLALSTHLPSPGGDPDQYEEEQSGKHIAGVYIFEAGPAGWTGIRGLPVSAIANRSPCHVGRIAHMRWLRAKRAWFLS